MTGFVGLRMCHIYLVGKLVGLCRDLWACKCIVYNGKKSTRLDNDLQAHDYVVFNGKEINKVI
jgi:hypothetical protein